MNHAAAKTMHSPGAALGAIIRAGFSIDAIPYDCQGSAEQAGRDAFDDGLAVSDALHFENNYRADDTRDGQHLSEWLCGFWKAHQDLQDDSKHL